MKKYDIFKSEGGYRVCLALWGDDPVISRCPWCKTLAGAKAVSRDAKFDDDTKDYGVFQADGWIASLPSDTMSQYPDYFNYDTRDRAVEAVISTIEKMGYSREYILYRRKDLK